LTDSKNGPKSGRYLKNLGWYDTRIKNKIEQIDTEAVKHWISKGAKLSLTLHNYLVGQKVITGKKLNALPKHTPIKKVEEVKKAETAKASESDAKESVPAAETAPAPAAEAVAQATA
jgi:ribosomal protein S16